MILSGKQTGRRADLSSDKNSLNLWVNMFFLIKSSIFMKNADFLTYILLKNADFSTYRRKLEH